MRGTCPISAKHADVGLQHHSYRGWHKLDLGDGVVRAAAWADPYEHGWKSASKMARDRRPDPVGHGRYPQGASWPLFLGIINLPHRHRAELGRLQQARISSETLLPDPVLMLATVALAIPGAPRPALA